MGKLDGWKGKLLSSGGNEVLIKAVAQSLPTYTMSLLRLPKFFSKEITSAIHSFWWSNGRGAKGISWVKKEELAKLKVNGGLGFRDLCLFNSALLAKQAWRFHSQPNALWVRILSGIYL